ncbi:MAG: hypothetical protein ACYTAU_16765 [Planctomycetota bacterium]|jgi:hypothetical protein
MSCSALKLVVPRLFSGSVLALSPPQLPPPDKEPFKTAEGLVGALYESVTFEAGSTPDWDHVRSMFIDEAVIVLRTSRDDTTVFSVEGFVGDFVKFIERADAGRTGFTERIIRTKPMVFGDMAHVLVLYEASIPGSPRPPSLRRQLRLQDAAVRDNAAVRVMQGVDSFSLIKKHGRWWIAAITNEIPGPDRPIPAQLRD